MSRHWLISAATCILSAATALAETWTYGPYQYDGAGNVAVIGPNDSFKYDEFGRISFGTAGPARYQSYEYDRFGNLTAITTEQNRLELGVNTATNQLTDTSKPAHAQYDAAGRMTRMTSVDPGGGFTYDALSMTKESTVDGVRKLHLYTASNERIASITMVSGTESRSEWTLRDTSNRVLRRLERTGGAWKWKQDYIYRDGQLLASEVDTSSGRLHFHPDHLGTARLVTGNGGVEVARHTYYPFGREIPETRLLDSERLKFTGHERDIGASPSTDLDSMHARSYSPMWERFLSVDPVLDVKKAIGDPQRWNRYAYVRNQPLMSTDPTGAIIYDRLTDIKGKEDLRKQLEGKTGIGLKYSNGQLQATGKIITDANGKQIGSATARADLQKALSPSETYMMAPTTKPAHGMAAHEGSVTYINFNKMRQVIGGNANGGTFDFAMIVMHELLGHGVNKLHDNFSNTNPTGDAVDYENTIRRELGITNERLEYETHKDGTRYYIEFKNGRIWVPPPP